MELVETMEKVKQGAESNIPDVRFIKTMETGKVVRQGDIYIHKVSNSHRHGAKAKANQLAFGTTKGLFLFLSPIIPSFLQLGAA